MLIRFPGIWCTDVPPGSPPGQDEALRSHSRSLIRHVHDHLPRDELQRLAQTLTGKRVWLRYQAVILAIPGRSAAEVAQALGWSTRAVPNWIARSKRGGPQALAERPHTGRRARLAGPELLRLPPRREAGPTPEDGLGTCYGRDLQRLLEPEFGVLMSRQAVSDRLHRHGFSSLMPRPQHKDAEEDLPAIVRAVVVAQIQALPEAHPDEPVQVGFEDEARFGQQGTRARVWARRGSRPRGVRQTQYTFLSVLTAVCASPGAASGLLSPTRNAEVVNRFLEQFAHEVPAGMHAVLLGEGAGYHTSEDLRIPKDGSLIQLLPYSPELNPVENLWHYLWSHDWSLRVYRDYEALEEAARNAWRAVCLQPELVSSICNAPYVSDCA